MRFFRPGWLVVYIVIFVCGWLFWSTPDVVFDSSLVIKEGDSLFSILEGQGTIDSRRIRRAADRYDFNPSSLKIGSYSDMVGSVSVSNFYDALASGPHAKYEKITILESWSIYDTDAYLVKKGHIKSGEYSAYATNSQNIRKLRNTYAFLKILPDSVDNLEGFLYPDTYHIDPQYPVIPQLVKLQLRGFDKNIWLERGNEIITRKKRRTWDISSYELLIMASVVLREDGNTFHQQDIAGVFLNRVKKGMRLGSDITLCYGLKKPSSYCSERAIVKHLYDKTNPYNTRAVVGLPPTPISSLTPSVVGSVVNVTVGDDVYFLIGKKGKLWTGKTLQDHQYNKRTYMQ